VASVSTRGLSRAANDSKIWLATAAVLAATGRHGRRNAAGGLVGVAASSALVNGPLKHLAQRPRPGGPLALGLERTGRPPKTSSFPSGHAATAAAFATATTLGSPVLALPLVAVASAVAWSRVATGRHFPSDVAGGIAVGATCGLLAHLAVARLAVDGEAVSTSGAAGEPAPDVASVPVSPGR
jgi:undecaprenyl-diphosphatase